MAKKKVSVARNGSELAKALGLPATAASEWRAKSELASALIAAVKREALTHAEVARRAKTSRTLLVHPAVGAHPGPARPARPGTAPGVAFPGKTNGITAWRFKLNMAQEPVPARVGRCISPLRKKTSC